MVRHVERMDEYLMPRSPLIEKVSGRRVRGMPGLGWMDGLCEGSLGQQMDDGGCRCCASMCEGQEGVTSPGSIFR